jgi:hypothetical protein
MLDVKERVVYLLRSGVIETELNEGFFRLEVNK